jgi:hypothetical protein
VISDSTENHDCIAKSLTSNGEPPVTTNCQSPGNHQSQITNHKAITNQKSNIKNQNAALPGVRGNGMTSRMLAIPVA